MLIEQIQQMQAQGYSEPDIVKFLQEQGNNPKEIMEAISQAKIKSAISSEEAVQNAVIQSSIENNEMQPSLMNPNQPISGETPNNFSSYANQDYPPIPTQSYQEQYPSQQYQEQYAPQPGQGYEQYAPQQYSSNDTETINEIAEQVVAEKISEIKKALSAVADFKVLSDSKLIDMEKRLKRIEKIIDDLQSSIIDKIGSYGKVMQDLRTELDATQESFSKVVNPLFDKSREKTKYHTTHKKKK
jgi:hypothetical protein